MIHYSNIDHLDENVDRCIIDSMKQFLLYTFIIAFVTACGMSRRVAHDEGAPRTSAYTASSYNAMQVSLRQAYRDWKGTPYLLGGRSASGVDCSSFVGIVFDEYFDVNLPTHTRRLLNEGQGCAGVQCGPATWCFSRPGASRSMWAL
ncbi:MAG: NlpC/P60 family protein [Balneolaceae bacterium]|nr:NlpC/P60 family protein [Balneolaceae bacterium]